MKKMKQRLMQRAVFKTALSTYIPAVWNGVNTSSWLPLGAKVLILPDQAAEETAGGIKLTADMVDRHTLASEAGVVVAKGPHCIIEVEPGSRVYMERYAGQLVTGHDERVYRLMDEASVGAVFKGKL